MFDFRRPIPQRVHFIDVPPPDVIWLAAGTPSAGAALTVPQVRAGARVGAGAVVAGVEHTSTVAVTPLAGVVGQPLAVTDSCGRARQAVPVAVANDAEAHAPPTDAPAQLGAIGRDDLPAWIDRLERTGVRADRHNSPDLIGQLLSAVRRPIDAVVCHALEADPSLPIQVQWALRHPLELLDGLRLLTRLTGARRTLLAVSEGDNRRLYRHLRRSRRGEIADRANTDATDGAPVVGERDIAPGETVDLPLESAELPSPGTASVSGRGRVIGRADRGEASVQSQGLGLRMIPMHNAYPQADPALLVWALLSRRLPPGRLPTEAGALVVDAVTAVAAGSVARGAGVVRREPVAVRDHRRDVSLLADVWRGSRAADVLRTLGLIDGTPNEPVGLRGGDFLRNRRLPLDCVLDGGELVLHLTPGDGLPTLPEPCIRCGWCLDICPTHVHPAGVLEAAQRDDALMAEQFGVDACIACGLCSYVCPSRLPLLEAALEMRSRQTRRAADRG